MSKHKTTKKKLIIEDDEPEEGEEELNPFSFKEFIRNKNQPVYPTDGVEKMSGAACQLADEYEYSRGFDHSPKSHFFTDPSLLAQSFYDEHEGEWTGNYQHSAAEQPHGLSGNLDGSAFLDHSLMSKDETVDEWEVGNDFLPDTRFHRKSTGSYEGDVETSVIDVTFQAKKNSTDNVVRDQQKLREENSQLRRYIRELIKKSEADSAKISQLTDEMHNRKMQEEREAKALETMVQSVEQNLQLMTKRAIKAENNLLRLKQEVQQLQGQVESYKCENERLRAGESAALHTMRQNAQVASEYLHKVTQDAESSIKQLLTGRETLCLVSALLSSIDKITEVPK
ncbi:endosome-associated-trafficking regulator 1 [Trichomycterus rosablanca]|uniref:endosome-associated-trafficking regulator 1 n=1 Tax=Trichomycterus rosablanca TaxID=2290929 RepID=UPI002F350563